MRYKKAPILEAVLELRWGPTKGVDELKLVLDLPVFEPFDEPKQRHLVNALISVPEREVSQESKHVGFELSLRDGSEIVRLEQNKFVYVKIAPYDCWENFSKQALGIIEPVISALMVTEFSRIGVRFVNRIDVPLSEAGNFNTDDYITVKFDGPRDDKGIIDEFQMRLVKPTTKENIAYALTVATSVSPLSDHGGIILDIDVFTRLPVPVLGSEFSDILAIMHDEKNDIFESCISDRSRALFGGTI